MPDIGVRLAEIEKEEKPADEKLHEKEAVLNDYAQKAERIHTVQPAAESLYAV
jgi:preprotein translocase subunit SecA